MGSLCQIGERLDKPSIFRGFHKVGLPGKSKAIMVF